MGKKTEDIEMNKVIGPIILTVYKFKMKMVLQTQRKNMAVFSSTKYVPS